MELVGSNDRIVLSLTHLELILLAGCVNEAIEAVEDWEFSTRLGVDKDAAYTLREELRQVLTRIGGLE